MRDTFMSERRLVKRMTTYWESLKKDKAIPDFAKFNSAAIIDVWDYCFTLSVNSSGKTNVYKYEHVGKEVVAAYGTDPRGEILSVKISRVPGARIVHKIDDCVADAGIKMEQGSFINDKSQSIKYRSCMLPFGREGKPISHVIVGLSWKSF